MGANYQVPRSSLDTKLYDRSYVLLDPSKVTCHVYLAFFYNVARPEQLPSIVDFCGELQNTIIDIECQHPAHVDLIDPTVKRGIDVIYHGDRQ